MVASYIFALEIFFLSSLSEEKMSKRGWERRKEKGREKEEDNTIVHRSLSVYSCHLCDARNLLDNWNDYVGLLQNHFME